MPNCPTIFSQIMGKLQRSAKQWSTLPCSCANCCNVSNSTSSNRQTLLSSGGSNGRRDNSSSASISIIFCPASRLLCSGICLQCRKSIAATAHMIACSWSSACTILSMALDCNVSGCERSCQAISPTVPTLPLRSSFLINSCHLSFDNSPGVGAGSYNLFNPFFSEWLVMLFKCVKLGCSFIGCAWWNYSHAFCSMALMSRQSSIVSV